MLPAQHSAANVSNPYGVSTRGFEGRYEGEFIRIPFRLPGVFVLAFFPAAAYRIFQPPVIVI
jgi:hypothetical protein